MKPMVKDVKFPARDASKLTFVAAEVFKASGGVRASLQAYWIDGPDPEASTHLLMAPVRFDDTKAALAYADAVLDKMARRDPPIVSDVTRDQIASALNDACAELVNSQAPAGDDGDAGDAGDGPERDDSQAAVLVRLATVAGWQLFHDDDRTPYASFPGTHGATETHRLNSKDARLALQRMYWQETGRVPRTQAIQDALAILQAEAIFDGGTRTVFLRVAGHGGKVYHDLCNEDWDVAEIDADGWRIRPSKECPVVFRRTRGMLALPRPLPGGLIEDLRPFLNAKDDVTFVLETAWLVGALKPQGPYPILNIHGEQGSAKSTALRVLRSFVDPSKAALRGQPRSLDDLMLDAQNSWVVAFDNLSSIPQWFSDGACCLSTGGGSSARELYTNDEQILIDVQRPMGTTGIAEYDTRPDYIDRSIVTVHPPITDDDRQDEETFWAEFERKRPYILGAILTAVSAALRNGPTTYLTKKPRMADFAKWMTAAEEGLGWEPGTFMAAYATNRQEATDLALESSALAGVLRAFVAERGEGQEWRGTAGELLTLLTAKADEATRALKEWPSKPLALSNALRRIAPELRAAGINVTFIRTGRKRLISLTHGTAVQESVTGVTGVTPRANGSEGASQAARGASHMDEGASLFDGERHSRSRTK